MDAKTARSRTAARCTTARSRLPSSGARTVLVLTPRPYNGWWTLRAKMRRKVTQRPHCLHLDVLALRANLTARLLAIYLSTRLYPRPAMPQPVCNKADDATLMLYWLSRMTHTPSRPHQVWMPLRHTTYPRPFSRVRGPSRSTPTRTCAAPIQYSERCKAKSTPSPASLFEEFLEAPVAPRYPAGAIKPATRMFYYVCLPNLSLSSLRLGPARRPPSRRV